MSSKEPVKLRIPRQDLQEFDFFPLSAEARASGRTPCLSPAPARSHSSCARCLPS